MTDPRLLGGGRRTPSEYVDEALAALDDWGPAETGIGLTIGGVAHAAGVTRSTIYRRWDTASELNEDLVWSTVTQSMGWCRRLLDTDPSTSFELALETALGQPVDALGVPCLSVIVSWPSTSTARAGAEAWEEQWLAAFATWLEAHLAAHGRAPGPEASSELLAVAITGLVNGRFLLVAMRHGIVPEAWLAESVPGLVAACSRLVASLTVGAEPAGDGPPAKAAPVITLPFADVPEVKQRIFQAVEECVLRSSFGDPGFPAPQRLVDIARLARRLGISDRRLYQLWPSAASFNAELTVAILERTRLDTEEVVMEALRLGLEAPYETFAHLLASCFQAAVDCGTRYLPTSAFACTLPAIDPEARTALAGALDDWRDSVQVLCLAMLAMAGWFRLPEVPIEEYTQLVFEQVAGLQRLVGLHPSLLARTVPFRGAEAPMLGLIVYHLTCSISLRERPDTAASAGAAPGLPGLRPD
ncbi:TetR/AcrR family transcriptional regulator [Aquihabitans sp. McL0605]|uniref:TetR/AcrR family transcriptional regulator n=1 Tax=Aquihabitans sp. McL0605 TaxID=3415671 RepID=UPI003CF0DE62